MEFTIETWIKVAEGASALETVVVHITPTGVGVEFYKDVDSWKRYDASRREAYDNEGGTVETVHEDLTRKGFTLHNSTTFKH